MSRFTEEGEPRRESELCASKRTRLSLIALLVGFTMLVASATIFAGTASAAPGDTIVPVPKNPASVNDPCGPNNASWNLPANADTDQFSFNIQSNGHLTVHDFTGYEAFPHGPHTSDQDHTYDYGLAPDSGKACPHLKVPPRPSVNDPCGPNNATWNVPASNGPFDWYLDLKSHLIVEILVDNTTFPDGTRKHDYGPAPDSGVACPPAVYAPHGKIIVNCNTRVSYVMDNRGSNRTVLFTAAWSYGKTKVVKRVYVKAHSKVTVTLYRVHRSARATLVARNRLLASVAHVKYWHC